jgi:hypothetical protein
MGRPASNRSASRFLYGFFPIFAAPMALFIASAAATEEMHVLELRRNCAATDCSGGNVYVDGKLVGVFLAAPSIFSAGQTYPFVGDRLVAAIYQAPIKPSISVMRGAELRNGTEASAIRLPYLDRASYSDYDRPRRKARALPAGTILVGTRLPVRECMLESTADAPYFTFGTREGSATERVSGAIIGTGEDGHAAGRTASVISVLTDSSSSANLQAARLRFLRQGALTSAEGVDMLAGDGRRQIGAVAVLCRSNAPDDGRRTIWKAIAMLSA